MSGLTRRERARVAAQAKAEQVLAWVRKRLGHAVTSVFDSMIALQASPGGREADPECLAKLIHGGYRLTKAGEFVQTVKNQAKAHSYILSKRDHEKTVWQNVGRLRSALAKLYPPGYEHKILVYRGTNRHGSKRCWLTYKGEYLDLTGAPAGKPSSRKPWRFYLSEEEWETGPIYLPFSPQPNLKVSVQIRPNGESQWAAPKYFKEYPAYRDAQLKLFQREWGPELAYNGKKLFFDHCESARSELSIWTRMGTYADHLATSKSLDSRCGAAGSTLRDYLQRRGWDPPRTMESLLPLPVASPITVDVMLTTKEERVAVCLHKKHDHWAVSFGGMLEPSEDVSDALVSCDGIIERAAKRRALHELGLEINPGAINWMAFGIGQEEGNCALVGELKVSSTEVDIRRRFAQDSKRENIRELEFVDLQPEAIRRFLEERGGRCRYFLRLGLHLCLLRRFPKLARIEV